MGLFDSHLPPPHFYMFNFNALVRTIRKEKEMYGFRVEDKKQNYSYTAGDTMLSTANLKESTKKLLELMNTRLQL